MNRAQLLRLAFLGLHPQRGDALIERYGSVAAVVSAAARGALGPAVQGNLKSADECAAALAELRVSFDVRADASFPPPLAGLPDSPRWLFRRGQSPTGPMVAMVGTRTCTAYGIRLAVELGSACAEAGWTVVSGLARGIDGAAHRGAIEAGGTAVAILGSGSDVVYPREHRKLHDRILAASGAVLSEYPPGTPPHGWRFPPRNRIISGLSRAVVVVESGFSGGSLSTAARAIDQGRMVFAVPGDVDRDASLGCNLLIRDGAIPILGGTDLIEALSLLSPTGSVAGR